MMTAEREGFEPPVPLGTTVFKTAAIDHSAISPSVCKSILYFDSPKKVHDYSRGEIANKIFMGYFAYLSEYI